MSDRRKTGPSISGNTLVAADAEQRTIRQKNADEKRAAVGRLVRAGLSDAQVSTRLRINQQTVTKHREALNLPANRLGGALD